MDQHKYRTTNATPEQVEESIRQFLSDIERQGAGAAVLMVSTPDNERVSVLVAGYHGYIEDMIAACLEAHSEIEPDEHERLEHFLRVGTNMYHAEQTVRKTTGRGHHDKKAD